jgi:nucleoside-diphosphate-sugar epimerase
VTGPPLILPKNPGEINETVRAVYVILSGNPIPPALSPRLSYVDNRDVARLMTWAVGNSDKANGERYIAVAGAPSNQAIADILNKHYPGRTLDKGSPQQGYLPGYEYPAEGQGVRIDSSKAVKATGKDWIDYETSVLDAAKAFEKYL